MSAREMSECEENVNSTCDLNEEIIQLIQKHRVIYDKSCKGYKNMTEKNKTWEIITRKISDISMRQNKSTDVITSNQNSL